MLLTFEYEQTVYLYINTISVIGSFNNYDPSKGRMRKIDDKWVRTENIPAGEYTYKFLINGYIELNDHNANMYALGDDEKLWSVLMINEDDMRLYNNTSYTVHIDDYNLSGYVNQGEMKVSRKDFNILLDKKIAARFAFTNITGIHSVTALWFGGDGRFFDSTENILIAPEEDEDKPLLMWFWLELQNKEFIYPEGIWTMKLFIDGEFILEDNFHLGKVPSYSPKGSVYFV